jgi:hypothetical protein
MRHTELSVVSSITYGPTKVDVVLTNEVESAPIEDIEEFFMYDQIMQWESDVIMKNQSQ